MAWMNRPRECPPGSPGQSIEELAGLLTAGRTEMGSAQLSARLAKRIRRKTRGHLQRWTEPQTTTAVTAGAELGPQDGSSELQTGGGEDGWHGIKHWTSLVKALNFLEGS